MVGNLPILIQLKLSEYFPILLFPFEWVLALCLASEWGIPQCDLSLKACV